MLPNIDTQWCLLAKQTINKHLCVCPHTDHHEYCAHQRIWEADVHLLAIFIFQFEDWHTRLQDSIYVCHHQLLLIPHHDILQVGDHLSFMARPDRMDEWFNWEILWQLIKDDFVEYVVSGRAYRVVVVCNWTCLIRQHWVRLPLSGCSTLHKANIWFQACLTLQV